ncbi:MAG: energy-coupled thiamine transporter ThiT [Oscillospiraceae bacterium]|nr:energy-coupled thiamine transporter ThiT [Oscillospiraceae bacterium]
MISPIIAAVFAVVYLLATVRLCRGVKLDARALCLGGVICALTLVLAAIRIPLPTGSNITCGSWIPLMLLALVYDYRLAMLTGWACGILVMILIPGWEAVHWAQIFVQQLVCFSCLGYAGVFGSGKRWKAVCGMALAVAIRCCGHVLSGVIFYSQNAWDGWGAWGYSLAFNSSRLIEGVLSILIVSLLPLGLMRRTALQKGGNA